MMGGFQHISALQDVDLRLRMIRIAPRALHIAFVVMLGCTRSRRIQASKLRDLSLALLVQRLPRMFFFASVLVPSFLETTNCFHQSQPHLHKAFRTKHAVIPSWFLEAPYMQSIQASNSDNNLSKEAPIHHSRSQNVCQRNPYSKLPHNYPLPNTLSSRMS